MAGPSQNRALKEHVKPPAVSEETVGRMLEQQQRETEVRRQELDLRAQEMRYNSAHAEKILGAQERDREAERSHDRKKVSYLLLFAGFCILLFVALVLIGMYMGKDNLVQDFMKVVGGIVAGAFGGYGLAQGKKKKETEED